MTQTIIQLPAPLPPLLSLRRNITKNYVDKLRLIIRFGRYCQKCSNQIEIDDLTVDHISPKFLCHKEHYYSDDNKQLLCRICHGQKSKYESRFMTRMTRRMIEEIHLRNNTIINVTDIVQEYRDSMKQTQQTKGMTIM